MKENVNDLYGETASMQKREVNSFFKRVYEVTESIPSGYVASYGMVAAACGRPRCARQVGWALHVNPRPVSIPCHRVVFADGKLSESFAFGGATEQRALLESEGVLFDEDGRVQRGFFCRFSDMKTFDGQSSFCY